MKYFRKKTSRNLLVTIFNWGIKKAFQKSLEILLTRSNEIKRRSMRHFKKCFKWWKLMNTDDQAFQKEFKKSVFRIIKQQQIKCGILLHQSWNSDEKYFDLRKNVACMRSGSPDQLNHWGKSVQGHNYIIVLPASSWSWHSVGRSPVDNKNTWIQHKYNKNTKSNSRIL